LGFEEQSNKFYILFEKGIDPIRIDLDLKNNIINLGYKYGINKSHDKEKYSEFIYLNSILEEIGK